MGLVGTVVLTARAIKEAGMVTIRCTRKLQALLDVPYTADPPAPENALGDWYANRIWTAAGDLIIFASEKTFLSVAMPAEAVGRFVPLFVARVYNLLRSLDVPEPAVAEELAHYRDVAIAKTASRSVLGVMNDIAWHYQLAAERHSDDEPPSLSRAELRLSVMPHIGPDYRIPCLVARELLGCSNEDWVAPW
jgi:hypothetical protein